MKILILIAALFRRTHLAANIAHLAVQLDIEAPDLHAANVLEVGNDGWAKLSAYGDFPNAGVKGGVPHIQRIDKAAGERLAANFSPLLKRLLRVKTGLSVFKEHPDAPGFETRCPDKNVYGTIDGVEARDDGIYVRPVITPEGTKLVERGYKFLSSFWDQEEVGTAPDGRPIASPFLLKSVGLVLRPNIPGPAINAHPDNQNPMNRKLVISLLTALGHIPAADITDAALEIKAAEVATTLPGILAANISLKTEHDKLVVKVSELTSTNTQLAANVSTLTTEKATLETAKTAAETAKADAEKSRLAAANSATSERSIAATAVVDAAILTGRLPAAEKAAKITALIAAANLTEEVTKIGALTPRLKIHETFSKQTDKTAVLDAQDRQAKVHAAVNLFMKEQGETDYTKAFQAVKADPKNAALFAAMAKPAAAV